MLFVSHKFNTNTCGFCIQTTLKDKVELFGFNSTSDKAAICSKCLLEIICNAINGKAKTSVNSANTQCNFCGQSIPDIIRIFTNGDLCICEECISNLISTSLWIGKKRGIEFVNEKYLMCKEKI